MLNITVRILGLITLKLDTLSLYRNFSVNFHSKYLIRENSNYRCNLDNSFIVCVAHCRKLNQLRFSFWRIWKCSLEEYFTFKGTLIFSLCHCNYIDTFITMAETSSVLILMTLLMMFSKNDATFPCKLQNSLWKIKHFKNT